MKVAINGIMVIAGKDLRNIFMSPLFYVVSGVCSLIWFLLFSSYLAEFIYRSSIQAMQSQGSENGMPVHFAVFYPHFSMVNLIMIFAVSAFTMRLFTEEKRNRTFDLLLTAPVTSTEIVVGKLIAGIGTAWALLAIGGLYPMSLAFFGSLDWGPFASCMIGLALLSAGYVAVGIFASSLTQSAVVSVMLALVFNVMLWFVGALVDRSTDPGDRSIIEHLMIGEHLEKFMKGSVSLTAVVFMLSLVFLFAFLTRQVVESARWRS